MRYREGGLSDPLSGISPQSFWPTLEDLKEMIQVSGFRRIQEIDDSAHTAGPCVTLADSSVYEAGCEVLWAVC